MEIFLIIKKGVVPKAIHVIARNESIQLIRFMNWIASPTVRNDEPGTVLFGHHLSLAI